MNHQATDTDRPLFSIFIPTWNNLDMLRLCVESIEKNSTFRHEILIHVNDGSDGTLQWVKEKGYKHAHSPENIGVCWAMNGLRTLMTTDYIMYVNDDMYMLPEWDKVLYDEIQSMPHKLWYLASTMIQPKSHYLRSNSVVTADFGRTVDTFDEAGLLAAYRSLAPADWRGAELPPTIVHRDTWDLVGGYSIEYSPGMASDPDFDAKLWLAGVRVFKGLGRSMCYHFMSVTVNRIVKNDGPIQFLRKYGMTIRAFRQQILRVDEPWHDQKPHDTKAIRSELRRSSLKKLITVFKNMKTARLWDKL
ncbi:MAG: glycosyltransferase [Bacteroides sp.]|nr:glycosyltransferase [Bacteroides sp.]MCM1413507.1 glycosyltransferase [Bacteroides sp.]MCM1471061.1 glycosyltransferase [Bacteroides sp.]